MPGFTELAKLFYEDSQGQEDNIERTLEMDMAFKTLGRALLEAPAWALLDIHKPFHLRVHQRKGIRKVMFIQTLGPWKRPVACLSKKLDPVAQGWPVYL